MVRKTLCGAQICVEESTNLDAVVTATTGDSVDMRWYNKATVFMICSANTGAVTVTIQASIDGTNWIDLAEKTYTAENSNDTYHYSNYYPYMRTKTTTHSASTVSTTIVGRS